MISKTVLDAQTTLELPAREMMFFNINWANVYAAQAAQSNSSQANVIGALQLNLNGQSNAQGNGVAINQS